MTVVIVGSLLAILVSAHALDAQERHQAPRHNVPAPSCDEFLPPPTQVAGKRIGPEGCRIVSEETVFNIKRQPYQRLELRISGTVEGWAATQGSRFSYFNDAPEFVFVQSGNIARRFKGVGRYSASTGHGVSLFLPENPAHWNGKLFVTAHGGPYAGVGTLIPRDPNADFNPLANVNRYVGLMLDRGFAVAHTLRSSHREGGDITVTLEDGTILPKYNLSSHAGFMIGLTKIAKSMTLKKLGRTPTRAYFYGFSAGGFLGRLIQYQPGFNRADDGRPLFDGFLLDDAGGGLWLPVLAVDGRDTLLLHEEDRKRFVPQIDITHQLYAGETEDFLTKKRENAQILKQKGLASKHRMYEIAGISHFDAGQVSLPHLVPHTLDLGGLLEALIDTLDRWVENGTEPPPTKSDLLELGGVDRVGVNQNPAIALPEVACPLGVFYPFPEAQANKRRAGQETAFAAFDGVNLEPLDGRGQPVDMNGNGVRDRRETVAQAWARLRLLNPGERFTQSTYVSCVANAAGRLVGEGFLPPRLLAHYVRAAVARGVAAE